MSVPSTMNKHPNVISKSSEAMEAVSSSEAVVVEVVEAEVESSVLLMEGAEVKVLMEGGATTVSEIATSMLRVVSAAMATEAVHYHPREHHPSQRRWQQQQ